jgi:hypothetical protein
VRDPKAEREAARKLTAILDGDSPVPDDAGYHATPEENAAVEEHLAAIFGDPSFESYFPQDYGIGIMNNGQIDGTGDSITTYHAELVLKRFLPHLTMIQLFDIDFGHSDYNAYLANQGVADACVRHLWETIQSTEGLRDETALLVIPEHGRQLFFNGNNPDSLGRAGLDHGGGDDGDRDVWALALGPDFKPGVYSPTGIAQEGRTCGRYETIDVVATAAAMLGVGDDMTSVLQNGDRRPGLLIEDILQ